MTVYVQFSDSTHTKIVSVFSCPQDPETYPNYAEIEETDTELYALYLEFVKSFNNPYG